MSDLKFKQIYQLFRVTTSSIKFLKNAKSDIISLDVYNNSPNKITLPLGVLGYCETNATISPTVERAYRLNNIQQLLDICQFTILNEKLSFNNITSDSKQNTYYFTKTLFYIKLSKIQNTLRKNNNSLRFSIFNIHKSHSKNN